MWTDTGLYIVVAYGRSVSTERIDGVYRQTASKDRYIEFAGEGGDDGNLGDGGDNDGGGGGGEDDLFHFRELV